MTKEATVPNWYVGSFKNKQGKTVFRVLRLRMLGTLERLVNGLAKSVLEYSDGSKWTKVKEKFVEVGGPFSGRAAARKCKAVLENKAHR